MATSQSADAVAIEQLQAELLHRRQAEQVLARLAAIVESSDDAIIGLTLDGTVVSWNRGAERVYGYTAEEIEGRPVYVLVPPDRHAKVRHRLGRVERGEPVEHYETVRLRKDGAALDVSISLSAIRNAAGAVIGASMIARDITERKRLEAQLLQAQKFEVIGQLSAGIAHEVNTPIQYIGNNATFLAQSLTAMLRLIEAGQRVVEAARQGPVPNALIDEARAAAESVDLAHLGQETRSAIQQTLEGVRRVAAIVRSVKELSHPSRGVKTPVDLRRLLDRAITVARNEWKYVAELETAFDPSLPPVPALEQELTQALLNVLINAAQAIEEIVGESGRKGVIRIATRHVGAWAEVSITDTGPGIPAEIRGKVFDPFFTTKEVGKGTGQGLAIARSIVVQQHGGRIDFWTQDGQGTTFVIRLPLEGPEQRGEVGHAANGVVGR